MKHLSSGWVFNRNQVANLNSGCCGRPGREFEHHGCAELDRPNAPRLENPVDSKNLPVLVDVQDVDGNRHKAGMNARTWVQQHPGPEKHMTTPHEAKQLVEKRFSNLNLIPDDRAS